MAERRNFLLGKGERLTEQVVGSGRKIDRVPPYSFAESKRRLRPMLEETVSAIDALPMRACPEDEAVGSYIRPNRSFAAMHTNGRLAFTPASRREVLA